MDPTGLGRATRLESSVLVPPRGKPPRRPTSHPPPAHPTQAWAMEGAAPDGNRGPNRGRPRRFAPLPPPAAAPGPPFPQSLGNRLPARRTPALRRPPSPLSTPSTAPATRYILFGLGKEKRNRPGYVNPSCLLSTEPGQVHRSSTDTDRGVAVWTPSGRSTPWSTPGTWRWSTQT